MNSSENGVGSVQIEQDISSQNGHRLSVSGDAGELTLSAFNLTDRLPVFSYLITTNRVRWYRVIMRFFLQCHRNLYRYQLTAQEIRDAVRETFDPDYTLDQCQTDLKALKDWGNITTIYDSSRATSIASFLSPALLYQATPEGIAIETFLDQQVTLSRNRGALRQGDLPRLWSSLQRIDEWLRQPSAELISTRSREIADEWQNAFEVWNTMAREAAQYLATMTNAAQEGQPNLEAYQAYKNAVVAYVQGFAQTLTQYSREVRRLLAEWATTGAAKRLLEIVAQYLEPPILTDEQEKRTWDELLQDARNQLEALTNWFAPGKNADSFRRNALAEVDKVVRRAAALSAAARPSGNYAAHLNILAHQLLLARDGEEAQELFALAFAGALPIHLPEGLAGTAIASDAPQERLAWDAPPTVNLRLRPVSRANRGDLTLEDPVIDNSVLLRDLVARHEAKLEAERARLAHLFHAGFLDTGALDVLSPEDRVLLMEAIDGCLGHPSYQYRAPDGATVELLNPQEETYALLRSTDGVLLLPRYRLRYSEQEIPGTEGNGNGGLPASTRLALASAGNGYASNGNGKN